MNFLEQLVSEWYEYRGYFVRRNIKFGGAAGKSKGGHSGEIDVLAYKPESGLVVHAEASGDYDTWAERKDRFINRKFTQLAETEYFKVLGIKPHSIELVAVVGHSKMPPNLEWKAVTGRPVKVIDVPTFITAILDELRSRPHARDVGIPENLPLLRAMHYVVSYEKNLN